MTELYVCNASSLMHMIFCGVGLAISKVAPLIGPIFGCPVWAHPAVLLIVLPVLAISLLVKNLPALTTLPACVSTPTNDSDSLILHAFLPRQLASRSVSLHTFICI